MMTLLLIARRFNSKIHEYPYDFEEYKKFYKEYIDIYEREKPENFEKNWQILGNKICKLVFKKN